MVKQYNIDVLISGSGVTASVSAILLKQAGFDVGLIGNFAPALLDTQDNRAIAIMNRQFEMLQKCNLGDALEIAPLRHLCLIDDTNSLLRAPTVTFHAADIGEAQFAHNVPIMAMQTALNKRVKALKIPLIDDKIKSINCSNYNILAEALNVKHELKSSLIIAADGKHSFTRILADISSDHKILEQTALSFTVDHALPHNHTSYEFHKQDGPLTFVPILHPNRSNVIWTVRHTEAARLQALTPEQFSAEFNPSCHDILGDCRLASPINAWPLSILRVNTYGKNRVALVGDAAHAFPPIGAQGLNLGLRDVCSLVEHLIEARNLGLDIGGQTILDGYSNARISDIYTVTTAVKSLNLSLISHFPIAQIARTTGLVAMETCPSLQKQVMKVGMAGF